MIKVNIGCGKWNFGEDWDHLDMVQAPHIKSCDIFLSYYEDNSIDIIYASHILEYFDPVTTDVMLRSWRQKLKPGGLLQIAVPDFKALCEMYIEEHSPIEDLLGPMFGRIIPAAGPIIYHRTAFDLRSLSKHLHNAGFDQIKQIETGFYKQFKDCSWAYLPDRNYEDGDLISLNVKCYKA